MWLGTNDQQFGSSSEEFGLIIQFILITKLNSASCQKSTVNVKATASFKQDFEMLSTTFCFQVRSPTKFPNSYFVDKVLFSLIFFVVIS